MAAPPVKVDNGGLAEVVTVALGAGEAAASADEVVDEALDVDTVAVVVEVDVVVLVEVTSVEVGQATGPSCAS